MIFNTFLNVYIQHIAECCKVPFVSRGPISKGHNYASNFEEVDGAYWFRVVRPCVRPFVKTVHARVLKFHIWISHGKIGEARFCSCPCHLSFWSYAPLKKIE